MHIQCPKCYALIYSQEPTVTTGVVRCPSCKGFALIMVSSVKTVFVIHNKKVPKHNLELEKCFLPLIFLRRKG